MNDSRTKHLLPPNFGWERLWPVFCQFERLRLRLAHEWALCAWLGLVPCRTPLLSDRGWQPSPAVSWHSSPVPAERGPGLPLCLP